jgi:hypothetical protein
MDPKIGMLSLVKASEDNEDNIGFVSIFREYLARQSLESVRDALEAASYRLAI